MAIIFYNLVDWYLIQKPVTSRDLYNLDLLHNHEDILANLIIGV